MCFTSYTLYINASLTSRRSYYILLPLPFIFASLYILIISSLATQAISTKVCMAALLMMLPKTFCIFLICYYNTLYIFLSIVKNSLISIFSLLINKLFLNFSGSYLVRHVFVRQFRHNFVSKYAELYTVLHVELMHLSDLQYIT